MDHLAPLVGIFGKELSKFGRRKRKGGAAQLAKPRLKLGIGEACIDLLVELVHDLGGRGPGRGDAEPNPRLLSPQEFPHGPPRRPHPPRPPRGHPHSPPPPPPPHPP